MNSKRGLAKVTIGDGTKYLRFTTNALVELEDELGISVTALLSGGEEAVQARMGFKTMRALLWAGLRGAGSRFSIADVGNMMDPTAIGDYMTAVGAALNTSLGVDASKVEEAEKDALRPTVEPPETAP
jgi:hypothetical protein